MPLCSNHVATNGRMRSLFMVEQYSNACVTTSIHPSNGGYRCCFHVFVIVNNAAINVVAQMTFWVVFVSFGHISQSTNAGLCGSFILGGIFYTAFHSGCTSL